MKELQLGWWHDDLITCNDEPVLVHYTDDNYILFENKTTSFILDRVNKKVSSINTDYYTNLLLKIQSIYQNKIHINLG